MKKFMIALIVVLLVSAVGCITIVAPDGAVAPSSGSESNSGSVSNGEPSTQSQPARDYRGDPVPPISVPEEWIYNRHTSNELADIGFSHIWSFTNAEIIPDSMVKLSDVGRLKDAMSAAGWNGCDPSTQADATWQTMNWTCTKGSSTLAANIQKYADREVTYLMIISNLTAD